MPCGFLATAPYTPNSDPLRRVLSFLEHTMPDPALQALLDLAATGMGIQIERRVDSADGTLSSYYVVGQVTGVGKGQWVNVTAANTDAQKNTAIRAALGVA